MKLIIKKIIFFLKTYLNLHQLNSVELSGKLILFSKFKLISKTHLEVPFSLGRTPRGISFKNLNNDKLKGSKQDLVGRLILDQLNGVSNDQIIKKHLLLLKKEENLTAAEVMHCPNNKYLKSYPAWASVRPWDKLSIKNKYDNYIELLFKNRNKHGAKFIVKKSRLKKEEIYSNNIAISHVKQYEKLIKSVREKGIEKTNILQMPQIIILINNSGQWRWIITAGTHRAYIFYFLGLEQFSAIIEDVIYRESLASCYNVKNKLYSLEEAENIFDEIFKGSSSIGQIV